MCCQIHRCTTKVDQNTGQRRPTKKGPKQITAVIEPALSCKSASDATRQIFHQQVQHLNIWQDRKQLWNQIRCNPSRSMFQKGTLAEPRCDVMKFCSYRPKKWLSRPFLRPCCGTSYWRKPARLFMLKMRGPCSVYRIPFPRPVGNEKEVQNMDNEKTKMELTSSKLNEASEKNN